MSARLGISFGTFSDLAARCGVAAWMQLLLKREAGTKFHELQPTFTPQESDPLDGTSTA